MSKIAGMVLTVGAVVVGLAMAGTGIEACGYRAEAQPVQSEKRILVWVSDDEEPQEYRYEVYRNGHLDRIEEVRVYPVFEE